MGSVQEPSLADLSEYFGPWYVAFIMLDLKTPDPILHSDDPAFDKTASRLSKATGDCARMERKS